MLTHAADDFDEPNTVRRLLRDLREVRMSKLRKGFKVLDAGAGVKMNGVGGMEIAEVRGFVGGVVDGLRSVLEIDIEIATYLMLIDQIGRSTDHEKNQEKSAKPKTRKMDSAVVATKMKMMICSYDMLFTLVHATIVQSKPVSLHTLRRELICDTVLSSITASVKALGGHQEALQNLRTLAYWNAEKQA